MSLPLVAEMQPIMHTIIQPQFKDPHLVYHVVEPLDNDMEKRGEIKGVKE